jgi:hypothetical protein
MITRLNAYVALIIFPVLLLFAVPANGQYDMVKRISAETADKLVFTVAVDQQVLTFGKDTILNYTVKNNSSKVIHLVWEKSLSFDTEGESILVEAPIPVPVDHGDYEYSFTKIDSGKEYKGQIIIPSKIYTKYDVWPIETAFGYVTDITGLNRRLRPNEDPANLRGLLYSRLKVVLVGKLSVAIKEPNP